MKRYICDSAGQNVLHRQRTGRQIVLQMMRMLEMKLIYILTKYEEQLDNIKQFNLYTEACKKHIEKFNTQEFLARANLTFFSVRIHPSIEIKSWEKKSDTTLFSLIIVDEKGELLISIHYTQNHQIMYSELRIIPGLTD